MSTLKPPRPTPHEPSALFISRDWRGFHLHYTQRSDWFCRKDDEQTTATLKLALSSYGFVIAQNTTVTAQQWIDAICKVYDRHDPRHAAVIAAIAKAGTIKDTAYYGAQRIAWELERTAMGDAHFGNALRVAKDIPGMTDQDRALLDRFATGTASGTDHVGLQDLAMRVRTPQHETARENANEGHCQPRARG